MSLTWSGLKSPLSGTEIFALGLAKVASLREKPTGCGFPKTEAARRTMGGCFPLSEEERGTPFAQRMVKDHQKTTAELKKLIDSGKVQAKLLTALDSDHQKMLDELKAKTGKEFDQSYDQIQVKAHQDAVALFEAYAKDG